MEKSSNLLNVIDDGAVLEFVSNPNGFNNKKVVFLEYLEADYDGIFANAASWKRFCNRINDNDAAVILNKIYGKKKNCDFEDFTVIRENLKWGNEIEIQFKNPIKCKVGEYKICDEMKDIIVEIDYIKGEVDWEWLFSRYSDFATAIDIFLVVKEYGKKCK